MPTEEEEEEEEAEHVRHDKRDKVMLLKPDDYSTIQELRST